MFLLFKGVINLRAAPEKKTVIHFKIQGREIHFSTPVPAFVLLLFGASLLLISLWFSKPESLPQITIAGEIQGVKEPVKMKLETINANSTVKTIKDKSICEQFDLNDLMLNVVLYGPTEYKQIHRLFSLSSVKNNEKKLGKFTMERISEITSNPNILNTKRNLPSTNRAGSFGR